MEPTVTDVPPARPQLTTHDTVAAPAAVVLVLHGGKDRSRADVTGRSLSWQRAAALARTLGRRLHDDRIAVRLLRYRSVGWNGDGADKIADARWALERIGDDLGQVPVVLVGHSLGGRTACHAADGSLVRGVVALAPWLPPGEPVGALAGKQLHAAHGRRDRITRASDTRAYVERAAAVTTASSFTDMGERGHYLLTGIHAWNAFADDRIRRILG
ncbi:MAG TPA: alpha/beta hydrolase [Nocardioides sp.]|nr:alpha/beta hydrolase [Nocardioides sp.]